MLSICTSLKNLSFGKELMGDLALQKKKILCKLHSLLGKKIVSFTFNTIVDNKLVLPHDLHFILQLL